VTVNPDELDSDVCDIADMALAGLCVDLCDDAAHNLKLAIVCGTFVPYATLVASSPRKSNRGDARCSSRWK
jgi:hypothetical protein